MLRRLAWILLACATTVAAAAPVASPLPPDHGALWVLLQPISREAGRLGLEIGSLAAVSDGGARAELALDVRQLRDGELSRERRLATGALPAGRYTGLELRWSRAVRGPEEEPIFIDRPFRIQKRQGTVLTLKLELPSTSRADVPSTTRLVAQVVSRPPVATLGLISHPDAHALTLFDKTSGSLVGVIPTGRKPQGMALDATRRQAYAALSDDDTLIALGLLEPRVLSSLRLRGGDQPTGLALTPDGGLLLAANFGSQTVSVVDPAAMVEIDRIRVGDRPEAVVVGSAGSRAYVLNTAASSVSVVDLGTRRLLATLTTEPEPFRGALDRAGDRLFVIHRFSPYLTVIDTSSLVVDRRVFVGAGVTALEVDPRTDLIYLAAKEGGAVEVYDPLSLLPVDSIPVAGEVSFLVIDSEENNLLVALPKSGEVQILRLVGKRIVARADLAESPYWVTLFGER